jgi:hypothetical protein
MGVCAFGGLMKASLLQMARIVKIALSTHKGSVRTLDVVSLNINGLEAV